MTKAKSKTDLETLRFELRDPINLGREQKLQIIHDIKAAALSYSMLIESMENQKPSVTDPKSEKKLIQLRRHEATLNALTERVIAAISEQSDARANS